MMVLVFLLYLIVAVQIFYKQGKYIFVQYAVCLLYTLYVFNYHSHLV